MKLVIDVTDPGNCLLPGAEVCIFDVGVATPNDTIGDVVFFPGGGSSVCVTEGASFTVFLLDVSNCTVNMVVTYSVNGGDAQTTALKSGNIPTGNTDAACEPPPV
ncbi:MAG TPA: hypothetical protein VFI44_12000 [Ornithinibacter sp.]|nr:hypothetical protein [Ornithinibacter sp.]